MHHSTLNTAAATNKHAAKLDAAAYSAAHSGLYGSMPTAFAETLKQALAVCYSTPATYLTYRQKFIAVKVEKPLAIQDKKNLTKLEKAWAKRGVYKVETPQGIIYRV